MEGRYDFRRCPGRQVARELSRSKQPRLPSPALQWMVSGQSRLHHGYLVYVIFHYVETVADQQSTWPDVKPSLHFNLRLDEKNIDSVYYIFDSL